MRESVFSTVATVFNRFTQGMSSFFHAGLTLIPYWVSFVSPFRERDLRKEVTEQYPDPISSRTVDDLPPRTKGLLHNDIHRCTGCQECERICPSRCIRVENEPGPDALKHWVSVFDIDFSKCVFCGLCVTICQPGSLIHTRAFEAAAFEKSALITHFGLGPVPSDQQLKWATARQIKDVEDLAL